MYKKIIIIAIVTVSLFGCAKTGTLLPPDQLSNGIYPKSVADLSTFLTPGYSNFRNANLYGYMYLPLVLSTDHTFCSQNSDGNPFGRQGGDFLTNNINVNNTPNTALYAQLYQGVATMNVFFERARYYQLTYGTGDAAKVNALRGQAYFLRAYYYYMLECFYGDKYIDMTQPEDPNVLGVPMPLTFLTDVNTEANLPRSTAYRVWSQIITDLDSSVTNLNGVTYDVNNVARVNQWAAKAMLGKAYVFTKQYAKARPVLLDVIQNSGKTLIPFAQYKNSFNGDMANEFNNESLFEINVDRQADQGGIMFSSNYKQSLTTNAGELWAPTIIGAEGVEANGRGDGNGGSSPNMGNNYCKFFVHDRSLRRFGFDLPVYNYEENPNSIVNNATTPRYIMDSASRRKSLEARTNNTVDPRLYVCALQPWLDSCKQKYSVDNRPKTSTEAQYPLTIPVGKAFIINTNRAAYQGWSFKKFATTENAILAYGGNDASNLYMLRLADVYLLYAEACVTSNATEALFYINQVHARAFNGTEDNHYGSLGDPTRASAANDILANDPLKYERYVELFGEGGWWFDVCRWGIGENEANYYEYGSTEFDPALNSGPATSKINKANWSGADGSRKAQHFPFPASEIVLNTAIQRNNIGY